MTALSRSTILTVSALVIFAGAPRVFSGTPHSPDTASNDIPQASALGAARQSDAAGGAAQVAPNNDASDPPDSKDMGAAAINGDLSKPITPDMKVQIIRYIDGEFGKAAIALPGKTNGFTLFVGKPISDQSYRDALRLQGTAISAGDPIQVTRVIFESKRIVLQLNGGARKKFHLMDHLQIGLGGDPGAVQQPANGSARRGEGMGAVILLDYGKSLPDVSPNDIKQELSPLIDFSKAKSAAVNWVETLPPAFQDAIRDHKALPGMDQQTVIAAVGRPDRKVREANADGVETESWIYGNPPAQTTFVTFIGEKVAKVEVCGGTQSNAANAPDCTVVR